MATTNKAFRVKTGLIVEGAELKPAAPNNNSKSQQQHEYTSANSIKKFVRHSIKKRRIKRR